MTTTLVHTSSREADARLAVARIAAGSRIAADRRAAAARRAAQVERARTIADEFVAEARTAGAVEVGFKVIDDAGKYRMRLTIDAAAGSMARMIVDGADVEAWGLNAAGEYVGEPW